jgi:hypothetical protein
MIALITFFTFLFWTAATMAAANCFLVYVTHDAWWLVMAIICYGAAYAISGPLRTLEQSLSAKD